MPWSDKALRINSAGSVLCEPAWQWDSHPFNDFDLWFVWTGRGTMRFLGQEVALSAGTIFCLQPGVKYIARHDPQHRLGVCFVHFDFVDDAGKPVVPPAEDRPPQSTRVADVDLHERLLKQVVALQRSGDPLSRAASAMHVRGVILALGASAARPTLSGTQREHHDAIWDAARYIRENPGDLFSIESLAERANYSADHFSRLFRQIVGVTPKEFCIRTRLERAQSLLAESSMGVEQVAAALGYADVFFFSRQFKQRTGVSPTQWRSRALSGGAKPRTVLS